MHFVVAFGVSFALTGNIALAGAIAMVEPLVQTFAYHFHEKMWKKLGDENHNFSIKNCCVLWKKKDNHAIA